MGRTGLLLVVCLSLLGASCGGGTAETTTSTAATTTTSMPTTIATTTAAVTTTAPATTEAYGFTPDDLVSAVLQNGDPWPVPIEGVDPFPITLDDIWPVDRFPEERATYIDAGFVAASFAMFRESEAIVLTGAHLFADAAGAARALGILEGSFGDFDLVAMITGLAPGSLNLLFPLGAPGLGDRSVGVLVSGPQAQVVGIIWTTDNLLQFVRAGMALGDEDRTAAVLDIARSMADRMA